MKKILFLLLVSFSALKSMEQSPTFTCWNELDTELQQYILEFIAQDTKDLLGLSLVSTKFKDLVSNHYFLGNFAKRFHRHDPKKSVILLKAAVRNKNIALAKALIEAHSSLKQEAEKILLAAIYLNPNELRAYDTINQVLNNKLDVIEALLKAGVDVNAQVTDGIPLVRACSSSWYIRRVPRDYQLLDAANAFHEKVVKLLLDYGADQQGGDALRWAAWAHNTAIIQLLLENSIKLCINHEHRLQAIERAKKKGNHESIVILLESYDLLDCL